MIAMPQPSDSLVRFSIRGLSVWATILAVLCLVYVGGCGVTQSTTPQKGGFRLTVEWPEVEASLVPLGAQSVRLLVQVQDTKAVLGSEVATRAEPTVTVEGIAVGLACLVTITAHPDEQATGTTQARAQEVRTVSASTTDIDLVMASRVASLSITAPGTLVAIGGTLSLSVVAKDVTESTVLVSADALRWSSSDDAIATVSSAGVVTGIATGKATITVQDSESGVSATQEIDVATTVDQIVFQSDRTGAYQIHVTDSTGESAARLTNNNHQDRGPAWSAIGGRIAFYSSRDGNWEIYSMNADGGGQTRLTDDSQLEPVPQGGAEDLGPTWSPDGTKIVFYTDRGAGNWEIYTMNADGTNPTNLTGHTAEDKVPCWSPDGSKIVFCSMREPDGWSDIYSMNADGTNVTRLTTWENIDWAPTWSPDGSKIAYYSQRGDAELFTMDADGANKQQITDNDVDDRYPSWSRDGSQLVFARSVAVDATTVSELYIIDVAAPNAETRLQSNSGNSDRPDWSWAAG